jgi:F0F1-type ATP synthase membrane subunit a
LIYNSILIITLGNFLILQINWLQQNTGLIGLISVIVAIVFFFIKTFNEKKKVREEVNERIIRICNVILNDVQDIENDLINGKFQKEIDEKGNEFFLIYLSTFIYESVINSGLYTYLSSKSQIELDHLYFNIKLRNETIRERERLIMTFNLSSNVTEKMTKSFNEMKYEYNRLINNYEKNIKQELTKVKDYINEDMAKITYMKGN